MPRSAPNSDGPSAKADELEEEVALLDRMNRGDKQALSEFYRRYYDPLYRFIYYQVGGNHADAEDVTQTTFIAAIDSLHTFRGESRLYVWLCGIAWHKAADFRRRRSKKERVRSNLPIHELEQLDTAPLPDEIFLREETRDLVYQVLLSLPDHYYQVLVLKYVEEFSMQEIAQLMGKSFKAVQSLLSRARNAFRAALIEQESRRNGG